MFNVNRFGFKFTDKVANPDSIVLFRKFRKESAKMESGVGIDAEAMDAVFNEACMLFYYYYFLPYFRRITVLVCS